MYNIVILLAQTVPEGRVFGLDQQTLIQIAVQLINVLILSLLLWRILYKPVKSYMQKRSDGISKKISNADEIMAEARALIAEYENKIENIDQESIRILEESRLEAKKRENIILEEAREEADRIRRDNKARMELDRARADREISHYIVEMSTQIAERYLRGNIDEEDQDKLFDQALLQLEEAQWRD